MLIEVENSACRQGQAPAELRLRLRMDEEQGAIVGFMAPSVLNRQARLPHASKAVEDVPSNRCRAPVSLACDATVQLRQGILAPLKKCSKAGVG